MLLGLGLSQVALLLPGAVEDCEATLEVDRERILHQIKRMEGGLAAFNEKLNSALRPQVCTLLLAVAVGIESSSLVHEGCPVNW